MKPMLTALVLSAALALPAQALEPINQEAHINGLLMQGFVADTIDDNCDTISARKLRALSKLNEIRDYALEKGYTRDEVKDFVTSKAEKTRLRAKAAEWLKAKGAEPGKPQAYCDVGFAEIAAETLIGSLLRDDR